MATALITGLRVVLNIVLSIGLLRILRLLDGAFFYHTPGWKNGGVEWSVVPTSKEHMHEGILTGELCEESS